MLGPLMEQFLRGLSDLAGTGKYRLHYTTAREMVNIILAACEGREGNPGDYRNHPLQLIRRR
jgi:hypothetical protein